MGADKTFTFDSVLSSTKPQVECYRVCAEPLLDSYFDGFNATLLAYGQTGVAWLGHAWCLRLLLLLPSPLMAHVVALRAGACSGA
jgi:hypothetical protein